MSLQLVNHTFRKVQNKYITFARNEYGRVGVFRIKFRSLVQKLYSLISVNFPTVPI